MANVKIKISIGIIQFSGEGEEKWIEAQLDKIIDKVPDLIKLSPVDNTKYPAAGESHNPELLKLTTGSIASKLKCRTGTDLAKAASAKLTLVDEKSKFSREELRAEMQSASAFYNKNHNKNLTSSLKNLVKNNVLLETASGIYALSEDSKNSLRAALD